MISALLTLLPAVVPATPPAMPEPIVSALPDDDPKLLHREPLYGGPGWRPGARPS